MLKEQGMDVYLQKKDKQVMRTLINTILFEEQGKSEIFNGRNKNNSVYLDIKKCVKRI